MSAAAFALAVAGILVSAAVAAVGWLTARRGGGRLSLHWLAGAAALWCLGGIMQLALGAPLGGYPAGLTLADLPPLLALPALLAGLAVLGSQDRGRPRERWRTLGQLIAGRPLAARFADGCLLAAALFVLGWITVFGPVYATAGGGAGEFAVQLVRPLAGLVVLAVMLPMAAQAGARGLVVLTATALVTVGDALGIGARLDGAAPGAASLAVTLTGYLVLGLIPFMPDSAAGQPDQPEQPQRAPRTTAVAAVAAGLAAVFACCWALAAGHGAPALDVVAGGAVTLLAIRLLMLATGGRGGQAGLESGQRVRELARLTGDVIVVCETDGVIRYASHAVADYGYSPEGLLGTRLDALIHPEDRPASRKAVARALRDTQGTPGRFPCRVRSADATWRHVESTVSPLRSPAAGDQIIIAARDVSGQVALRRQVTHLTFHDGLTGLPNRAYLEERAIAVLGPRGGQAASGPGPAGVIFVDLDGFTAVNDSVGHRAGDLLIAQAATRLRAAVPAQHTLVRWGGDEFAVLAEEPGGAAEVADLAERLAATVAAEPFLVAGQDVSMTASVGVALAGSDPPAVMLRNAEVAMTRAKRSGGGRAEVFAARMHEDVVRRLEPTTDLKQAGDAGLEAGTAHAVSASETPLHGS